MRWRAREQNDWVTRELGWIPAFSRCGVAQLGRIDALSCRLRVPAGKELVARGGRPRQALVILDGVATVTGTAGTRSLFAGEAVSVREVHEQLASDVSVVAASDMTVLVFGPTELADLLEVEGVADGLLGTAVTPVPELDVLRDGLIGAIKLSPRRVLAGLPA